MATENDVRLAKNIQKLRKQTGLTQEDLAAKLKLSAKYEQFIENANRIPSLKTVYKIARALNVKVKDLFPF